MGKMFEKGGPLNGIAQPIITFNKHGADYVKNFPVGKAADYDAKTGKKKAKKNVTTTAAAAAKAANESTVEEDDYLLKDTVAQQVLELDFVDGASMEPIKIANLTKGMLQICMM